MYDDENPESITDLDAAAAAGDDAAIVAQELSLLGELREIVVQRELELAELLHQSRRFHARYVSTVGVHQAELDEVRAQIARLLASVTPDDDQLEAAAAEATRLAEEARRALRDARRQVDGDDADDDEELDEAEQHRLDLFSDVKKRRLRAMFRELARRVHPDLALDDETRAVRTDVMADVIAAYEAGDERRLRMMTEAYVELDGRGKALGDVAPIRQLIVRMRLRLEALDQQIAEHRSGFLFHLARREELEAAEGGNLLEDLAESVRLDVEHARAQLAELEGEMGGS
jgi:hypothetical protein